MPTLSKIARGLKAWSLGFILLTGLYAARSEEFPGESAKWRRYQSPNFELFSAARDGPSRELLHHLELLRALFFDSFQSMESQPLPVTVYYFADAKDFKAYAPESQRQALGGYYLYRPDRAVIAIAPVGSRQSARYIIFHEYIHHLNRAVGATPPLWYNEGVAELFSTIEFKPDGVILGKHLPWHIDTLKSRRLMPMETLFAIGPDSPVYNNGKHSGRFYAQSWLLLHYLRYGENQMKKENVERLFDFFLNESSGTDSASRLQMFKETTGSDYFEMGMKLEAYLRKGVFYSYKAKLPQIPDMKSYTQRAMPREEIATFLAELSLRVNQSAKARLRLLHTAEKEPANTRCWEALGADAWSRDELDVAQERWQRALDAGSGNPAVFHEVGRMESRRWFANFDFNFRLPAGRAQQLRTLLLRSIASVPEQSDAYETLAWVEASVAKPDITNVNLVEQRLSNLRQKDRTVLALAVVRMRLNERDAARKLLDQIDGMNPGHWVTGAAEIVRAKLEDRRPRPITPPPKAQTQRQRLRIDLPELPE